MRLVRLSLVFALVSVLVAGCGSGRASVENEPSEDTGSDVPDVPDGDDAADVGMDVPPEDTGPDLPDGSRPLVEVRMDPARAIYRIGQTVSATAQLVDEDGRRSDASFTWTFEADTALTEDAEAPATWTIEEEGRIVLTACTDDTPWPDPVCGDGVIIVDMDPPMITITSPRPGQQLATEQIVVEGTVSDTSAPDGLRVYLAGRQIDIAPDGSFVGSMEPEFGVNHIEVIASDGLNRREGSAELDVMWAPAYLPAEPDTEVSTVNIDDALRFRLGREVFDDGMDYLRTEDGLVETSDLVDVIEVVLDEIDALALLPSNPVTESDTLTLAVDDLVIVDRVVDLEVGEEGLELFIQLRDITAELSGFANVSGAELSLDGVVRATASAYASLRLIKSAPDEPLEVDISAFSLAIDSVDSDFVDEEANAVFEVAEGALRLALTRALRDALGDGLVDAIPDAIGGVLTDIDDALTFEDLSLAADPLPPVTLSFAGRVSTVEPEFRTRVDIVMDGIVSSDTASQHGDSPGVALATPRGTEDDLRSAGRVQLAVDLALLNGLMHVLWDSGLLEADLSSVLPDGISFLVETVVASGQLPPLITGTPPDSEWDLAVTIGQLELTLTRGPTTEVIAIQLTAFASLDLVDNAVSLTFADLPTVDSWLVARNDGNPIFSDPDALNGLITGTVWPLLAEQLAEGLSIPLPDIDLSTLASVAPTLDGLSLSFALEERAEQRGNDLVLELGLVGSAMTVAPMP